MSSFFFFNDTATTEIYTLSLHDALPISGGPLAGGLVLEHFWWGAVFLLGVPVAVLGALGVLLVVPESKDPFPGKDRKSTRLNSSHANISYAVFCLKKKKIEASEKDC